MMCHSATAKEHAEEEASTADELAVAVQTLAGFGARKLFAPMQPSDLVRLPVLAQSCSDLRFDCNQIGGFAGLYKTQDRRTDH